MINKFEILTKVCYCFFKKMIFKNETSGIIDEEPIVKKEVFKYKCRHSLKFIYSIFLIYA
jgi:hypothetical protein